MIRREIVLPAPREEVWEALTEPERLADWFANDVDLDLRPRGGAGSREAPGDAGGRGARRVRAARPRDALPADARRRGVGRPPRRTAEAFGAGSLKLANLVRLRRTRFGP